MVYRNPFIKISLLSNYFISTCYLNLNIILIES